MTFIYLTTRECRSDHSATGIDCGGDANAAIRADSLVETPPGAQVRIIFIPGESFQVFKRTPVLYQHGPAQFEVDFRSQESFLGMLVQGAQHWPHRPRRGNPLAKSQELVDAYPNQKNNKGFIRLSRKSPWYHFSHITYSFYSIATSFVSANVFKVAMVSSHQASRAWHLCIPYLTVIRE